MTPKRFLLLGFALVFALGVIKFLFINILVGDNVAFYYTEWTLIALASIAAARRLGIINYLEAILAAGMWWLFALVFDFLITSALVGFDMFRTRELWIGYLVMVVVIFIFHKKRHVKLRHELHH